MTLARPSSPEAKRAGACAEDLSPLCFEVGATLLSSSAIVWGTTHPRYGVAVAEVCPRPFFVVQCSLLLVRCVGYHSSPTRARLVYASWGTVSAGAVCCGRPTGICRDLEGPSPARRRVVYSSFFSRV